MKCKTSQVWTEYVSVHNAQNNFKEETELTANKNNFVITGLVLAAFPLYFNEKKEVENDIRNTMNLKCREMKRKLWNRCRDSRTRGPRHEVTHLEKAAKLIRSVQFHHGTGIIYIFCLCQLIVCSILKISYWFLCLVLSLHLTNGGPST